MCVRTCLSCIGVPSVVAIEALRIPHQKGTSDPVSSSEEEGHVPCGQYCLFQLRNFHVAGSSPSSSLWSFIPMIVRCESVSEYQSIRLDSQSRLMDGSGSDRGTTPPANTSPLHSRIFIQNGPFREPRKKKKEAEDMFVSNYIEHYTEVVAR